MSKDINDFNWIQAATAGMEARGVHGLRATEVAVAVVAQETLQAVGGALVRAVEAVAPSAL
ncbi:hypothetical protein H7097_00615 [Aeromicrobium sp.]|nr:hypothetical protein [Candidatus Saccharibacteria bacterium]